MALAKSGYKIILLEAGSPMDPAKEFHHRWPYELPFRGAGQPGLLKKYFQGSTEYNYRIMIDDRENPYTTPEGKPFCWYRSRVLGGRTLTLVARFGSHVRLENQSRVTGWIWRQLPFLTAILHLTTTASNSLSG